MTSTAGVPALAVTSLGNGQLSSASLAHPTSCQRNECSQEIDDEGRNGGELDLFNTPVASADGLEIGHVYHYSQPLSLPTKPRDRDGEPLEGLPRFLPKDAADVPAHATDRFDPGAGLFHRAAYCRVPGSNRFISALESTPVRMESAISLLSAGALRGHTAK